METAKSHQSMFVVINIPELFWYSEICGTLFT